MTLAMILIILLPFLIIGATLADNVKELTAAARHRIELGPPAPPDWLGKVPVIGPHATEYWQSLAHDTTKLWQESRGFIESVSSWLLKVGLGLGSGLLELALSIFITFFLFRHGDLLAGRLTATVDRIGGARGKHLLAVAGHTIRGVVYGILGTALSQAVAAGIGFLIAGVPGAGFLALLTFFFSIVPVVGTAAVWIPAALWLFHQGSPSWAVFMLVWGVGVSHECPDINQTGATG
jgi:predicted PurR-regulated permease PerM